MRKGTPGRRTVRGRSGGVSIREAAAAIRAGLDLLASGRAVLLATAAAFAEARTGVEQATRGTNRPEAAQAIGALTTALEAIDGS